MSAGGLVGEAVIWVGAELLLLGEGGARKRELVGDIATALDNLSLSFPELERTLETVIAISMPLFCVLLKLKWYYPSLEGSMLEII